MIKDPEILGLVPDHLKKLPFIIKHVPDQYKTQ